MVSPYSMAQGTIQDQFTPWLNPGFGFTSAPDCVILRPNPDKHNRPEQAYVMGPKKWIFIAEDHMVLP
jgi:hypothetical protein